MRHDALQKAHLALLRPYCRIETVIVNKGFAKGIRHADHVPAAEPVCRSGVPPFVEGVPVDSDRTAGHDLVTHQVHQENVVPRMAPPGVVLKLIQGGITTGFHHHGGATHEFSQHFGTRVLAQPLCIDFVGRAGRWQVGLVNPRADQRGMTVPSQS